MTDHFALLIQAYWPIFAWIAGNLIGVGVIYANLRNHIENAKTRITSLESDYKAINPILLRIQLDLAEIKTTLKIMLPKANE